MAPAAGWGANWGLDMSGIAGTTLSDMKDRMQLLIENAINAGLRAQRMSDEQTITVRRINSTLWRELAVEAKKRRLTLGQALMEAINHWLEET